jgi:hypothetical protein
MDGDSVGTILLSILIAAVVIPLYFAPWIYAKHRRCKSSDGIAAINLFLGWTFVGWVVALAWAASGEQAPNAFPVGYLER